MAMDSANRRRQCRPPQLSGLCAALLLSSPATRAFTSNTPAATKSSLTSRSAVVIQRYRVENESSGRLPRPEPHQSDVQSFLPSRLTTIERIDRPSQFRTQVLEEEESLVVVRFFAEACPSCRATAPFFRKWSRDIASNDVQSNVSIEGSISTSPEDPLSIRILEMPLNKATSAFIKDDLQVEILPYCHVYHPYFGLVDEQLVMNKVDFADFVDTVDVWSKGGCDADLGWFDQSKHANCEVDCERQNDGECEDFC